MKGKASERPSLCLFGAMDLESSQALPRSRSPTGSSASCLVPQCLRNSPSSWFSCVDSGFRPTRLSPAEPADTRPAEESISWDSARLGLHPRAQGRKELQPVSPGARACISSSLAGAGICRCDGQGLSLLFPACEFHLSILSMRTQDIRGTDRLTLASHSLLSAAGSRGGTKEQEATGAPLLTSQLVGSDAGFRGLGSSGTTDLSCPTDSGERGSLVGLLSSLS